MSDTRTPGKWNFACDSYGKVQHSRKACVFTVIKGEKGGDRIVSVAARIENWKDARLIAAAPDLLAACKLTVDDAEHAANPSARLFGYQEMKAAIAKVEAI